MTLVRCNVCRGEYETELRDGSQYFHVCPPLTAPEARELLAAGTLEVPADLQKRLARARTLDTTAPRGAGEISRVDELLHDANLPRPGARNENIHGASGRGRPNDPIADGTGTTTIYPGGDGPRVP
jgi:hypothetical protein